MKRFLSTFLAGLFLAGLALVGANARIPLLGAGKYPAAGSSFTAPTLVVVPTALNLGESHANDAASWAGVSIGTADANRQVIVAVSAHIGGAKPADVTIAGTGATMIVETYGDNRYAGIWCANVAAGTTGTIAVDSPTNQVNTIAIAVYRMVKSSCTASATGSDPAGSDDANITIAIPSSGAAVYSGATDNAFGGGAAGIVGTGVVDDYSPAGKHAFASSITAGSNAATFVSGGGGSETIMIVGASWGP